MEEETREEGVEEEAKTVEVEEPESPEPVKEEAEKKEEVKHRAEVEEPKPAEPVKEEVEEKEEEEKPPEEAEEEKVELKSEILDKFKERFSDAILEARAQKERRLVASVKKEALLDICSYLRKEGFDHLSNISGVDYGDRFEVVYHLWSWSNRNLMTLKVGVPRDSPEVPSIISIWKGADWHERETFDLMGIVFKGHPNLARILLPEDFEGHPLRKDYKLPEDEGWFGKEE
jgi:NADH-quinone oxidoreductase subunit C